MHLNKQQANEVLNDTDLTNQQKIHWLANTGFPRSLVTLEKVKAITKSNASIVTQPCISRAQCKSFNNSNNIKIKGLINLELQSGSWSASTGQVSVVGHNTSNLMGRDILQKLVISVHQAQNPSPGNHIYSVSNIEVEQNIIERVFSKYLHLFTRTGKSKNHIARSVFKPNHTPNQQKGRQVPLQMLEKMTLK